MISGAVLPMQSFPGDVCGLRVSQLVCFHQWLRLSSCLCVCSVLNGTMCAITKHFKDPSSHLDHTLIKSNDHDHPNHPPWSDTWCASPWSCSPWTWARPTWRTRCPRGSSSGTPGALSAQKVTNSLIVGYQKLFPLQWVEDWRKTSMGAFTTTFSCEAI